MIQKEQSEGVKASWRFSKGQGTQFISFRERNTTYGVHVVSKVEMSESYSNPQANVSQPRFVAKHKLHTPHLSWGTISGPGHDVQATLRTLSDDTDC